MKKLIALLCLALLFCLTLSSCGVHAMGEEMGDNQRYAVKTALETSQLQFEYEKDGATVGVYYLGRVSGVPFSPSETMEHTLAGVTNAEYKTADFDAAAFATSKSRAIAQVISTDIQQSVSFTDAGGTVATVPLVSNAVTDVKYNIRTACADGVEATTAYAFADAYATAAAFFESKSIGGMGLTYKKGILHDDIYIRVALFATCDFYAFVTYQAATNTVSVTYDLAIVEGTMSINGDQSADGSFAAVGENHGSLAFTPSVLSNGAIFEGSESYAVTYVTNGGTFSDTPKLTYTAASATLTTPERTHFAFGGWYFDEALTEPATPETLRQRAADVTVYAKWSTVANEFTYGDFTGLTSNIKGEETGRVSIAGVANDKLQAYINEGYRARVTFYYTIGVPLEYEGTKDSSDLKVELGFAKDTASTDFIEFKENYHASVAPGSSESHSISTEANLAYFVDYYATVRTVILSNDDAVLGICGRDAGTYSNLKMVIEYIK